MTNEGPAAVQEAINHLKKQKPVAALTWDSNIAKAARDHVRDSDIHNIVGHTGSDGSSFVDRLDRYTTREGRSGENIDYGTKSAQEVMLALLIDDGVPSRGHRTNIFQEGFMKMGAATSSHPKYG